MDNFSPSAATDKAVFDAVNQHKISKDEILGLFFSRGVIVSKKTEKEDLAKEFSSLFHSYSDYDKLSSILGTNHRREKLTSYTLETTLKSSDVEDSLKKIKDKFKEEGAQVHHRIEKQGKKIELDITYQEINLSKNDFQQVHTRDAVLTIEQNQSGLDFQHPQNKKLSELSAHLIDILESKDKALNVEKIELVAFEQAELRSLFFEYLTNNLEGFKRIDVTDTYVYNPQKNQASGETQEVHITSAALKGTGVNLSQALKQLHDDGFYTWKVIWKAIKEGIESSDLYTFEVQFSDAAECQEFSYMVKGVNKRKSEGVVGDPLGHNTNRIPVSRTEEQQLNKLIKKSAWEAISKLGEHCSQEGDENDDRTK